MGTPNYTWPGLASYTLEDSHLFYGRDIEKSDLFRKVNASRLTIVYGASGTGKTSLLQAGIAPQLLERKLLPVFIRLSFPEKDQQIVPLVGQLNEALVKACSKHDLGINTKTHEYFTARKGQLCAWEWARTLELKKQDETWQPVFIFDQFEEVFTLGKNVDGIDKLLSELGDFAEGFMPNQVSEFANNYSGELPEGFMDQNHKVVITLREDYLARLQGLKQTLPGATVRQNYFALSRLNGASAFDAVIKPAPKGVITPMVAEEIVRFVASASNTETAKVRKNTLLEKLEVEPAILSLVCQQLDQKRIAKNEALISADFVKQSRDQILVDFYENGMLQVAVSTRYYIEDRMLDAEGFRTSEPEANLNSEGILPADIQSLIDQRLLHRVEHYQRTHLELSHDVLCGVVKQSRDSRYQREKEEQQKLAISKLNKQRRRIVAIALVFALLAVIAGIAFYYAINQKKIADEKTDLAKEQTKIAKEKEKEALAQKDSTLFFLNEATKQTRIAELQRDSAEKSRNEAEIQKDSANYFSQKADFQAQIAIQQRDSAYMAKSEAEKQRSLALEAEEKANKTLALNYLEKANTLIKNDETSKAIPFLTEAVRLDKNNNGMFQYLTNIVANNNYYIHIDTIYYDGSARSVEYSADGKKILVTLENGTTCILDANSGSEIIQIESRVSYSSYFSSDEKKIITNNGFGNWWGTYTYGFKSSWDVKTGGNYSMEEGIALAHSPNGRYVFTQNFEGKKCRIYDTRKDNNIKLAVDTVIHAEFSNDNSLFYTQTYRGELAIWSVPELKLIKTIPERVDESSQVFFTPAWNLIGVNEWAGNINFYNVLNGELKYSIQPTDPADFVSYNDISSSNFIICGNNIEIWSYWGEHEKSLKHDDQVNFINFNSDNRLMLSGYGNKVRIWDWESGLPASEPIIHGEKVIAASFESSGNYLFTSTKDYSIKWKKIELKEELATINHRALGKLNEAYYSPSGDYIAMSSENCLLIWDANKKVPVSKYIYQRDEIRDISFSSDSKYIGISSRDSTVQICLSKSGERIIPILKHNALVNNINFSKNNKYVATASWDGTAILWDLNSGNQINQPIKHGNSVWNVTFSEDSRFLASCGFDNCIKIVEIESGKIKLNLKHDSRVYDASFDMSGNILITKTDEQIHIWNLDSASILKSLPNTLDRDRPICFDKSNNNVLIVYQNEAWLYNINSLEQSSKKFRHKNNIQNAHLSNYGRYLTVILLDNTVVVWDIIAGVQLFNHCTKGLLDAKMNPSEDKLMILTSTSVEIIEINTNTISNVDFYLSYCDYLSGYRLNETKTYLIQDRSGFKYPDLQLILEWGFNDYHLLQKSNSEIAKLNIRKSSLLNNYFNTDYKEYERLSLQDQNDSLLNAAYLAKMVVPTRDLTYAFYNIERTSNSSNKCSDWWYFKSLLYFTAPAEAFFNEDAFIAIDKAIELNPNSYLAILLKSQIVREQISKEEYNTWLRKSLNAYMASGLVDPIDKQIEYLNKIIYHLKKECLNKEIEKVYNRMVILYNEKYLGDNSYYLMELLSELHSSLAYVKLIRSDYHGAFDALLKSIEYSDENNWTYKNLAHYYLLNGKYEEAKDLYLKYKKTIIYKNELNMEYGRRYFYSTSTKSFKTACLEDFAYFEEHGITHPDIQKIKELLSN